MLDCAEMCDTTRDMMLRSSTSPIRSPRCAPTSASAAPHPASVSARAWRRAPRPAAAAPRPAAPSPDHPSLRDRGLSPRSRMIHIPYAVTAAKGGKGVSSRQVKYVFVKGGVVSSLGKGITAASLGRLLKSRGLRVSLQKFDPYINVDPGTMSPFQHGEVFRHRGRGETDSTSATTSGSSTSSCRVTRTTPPARSTTGSSVASARASTSGRPCRSSRTSPTRSSAASSWPASRTTSTWSSPRSAGR